MSILDQFLTGELQDLPNDTHGSAQGNDIPHNDARHHSAAHHKRHHSNNAAPAHTNAHGVTNRQKSAHAAPPSTADANQNFNAQACLPSRQKNASDFLAGNTPGVMAFYAPEEQCATAHNPAHPNPQPANINANTRPDNATVEDAETVQRLMEWREEASY